MDDLWAGKRRAAVRAVEPLAVRMRPRTLDEIEGQEHILGPGKLLRRMLHAHGVLTSLILYGPPGTGKTSLAEVIALHTNRHFERENASAVGVARIREIIKNAEERLANSGRRTVLFLDEIHRFSKSQQDVLLGDVERGLITLIGATTENPLFAVNSALVSRSTLFRLELLPVEAIKRVLRRAIGDAERGYGKVALEVHEAALDVWAIKSDGDARRALTALEVAVLSGGRDQGAESRSHGGEAKHRGAEASGNRDEAALVIDRGVAEESIQQKAAAYSGTGDEHYDSISGMIKSVRGSDPDAAVYWIARMLDAGEDPRYIARRLAVLASEDIGNADPRGIMVAAACWELVERIGMPEARITLAQCATYLSMAPKSNASYVAIERASADVKEGRTLPVPMYLRDANSSPVSAASESGVAQRTKQAAGERYEYSHDVEGNITGQDYLGVDKEYYQPTQNGAEKAMAEKLERVRKARREKST
ncbi:MAG: replication-associated recombination protein A [Phycisphaerales bacterium]